MSNLNSAFEIDCRPRQNMNPNPLLQPRCVGLKVITPIMCHICEQCRKPSMNQKEQLELMKIWHEMVDQQLEMEAK